MELWRLVVDCKVAITKLINYIGYHEVDIPFEIGRLELVFSGAGLCRMFREI